MAGRLTKNIATLPPHLPFGETLAKGLWERAAGDSFLLSASRVFLPTRRACRELRTAFLRLTEGKPLMLPRLSPIGEAEEDELSLGGLDFALPPAIAPLRRQMLLLRLVRQKDPNLSMEQAAALSESLAALIDRVQIEGADFADLPNLVEPGDLAKHWEETVRFLEIVTDAWPKVLAEEGGLLDPADRRNRLLKLQAEAWRHNPPDYPIIAAGSTGTMPAIAEWLEAISTLPQGEVILPGLDQEMDEEAWQEVEESHPQFGMKLLLERVKLERRDVALWSYAREPETPRLRLLREAMRPAATTEAWRDLTTEEIPSTAFEGLETLVLDHPQEEADAIALRLRGLLEEPEKTAMLVTPDRTLALRAVAALRRWNIEANDSAGLPLDGLPLGSYWLALLKAVEPGAAAVALLGLLKHPLMAAGLPPALCRERARQIEILLWHGPRRNDGWEALRTLPDTTEELKIWGERLIASLHPLSATWQEPMPFAARLQLHMQTAEKLATTDETEGSAILWRDTAGDIGAGWIADLEQATAVLPPCDGAAYAALFEALLRRVPVREPHAAHGRIHILGPMEARLQRADLVIIAGLNEGTWPMAAEADPWMSRPMQKRFGLPVPERRIGLAAHDFVQLAAAPRVLMTRAARKEGSPTVPSRFWLQIETVRRAAGHPDSALHPAEPWVEWTRSLDRPAAKDLRPCPPPEPRPAATDRPRSLSVTEISTWMKNPYAIYARHILGLKKLDPIDAPPDASDRGNLLHKALENFCRTTPEPWGDEALDKLLAEGREVFAPFSNEAEVEAFWWPRFEAIAAWFIERMGERQAASYHILSVEAKGERRFAEGRFTLRGRADRIDRLPDGHLAILDYKTGGKISKKAVAAGFEPQLFLLASIAAAGGFPEVPPAEACELAYWYLKSGRAEATIDPLEDLAAHQAEAERNLESLIQKFADEKTPYLANPRSTYRDAYDDYALLARRAEWNAGGEE